MRRLAFDRGRQRWLAGLAVVAFVGVSSVVLALSVRSAPDREPPPAETVASRFPAEWDGRAAMPAAAFALARAQRPDTSPNAIELDWLAPSFVLDLARQDLASLPATKAAPPGAREGTHGLGAGAGTQSPALRHGLGHKATLLNDAQIASIKERLKLTAEQEQLWPPVEAALRAVAWRGPRERLDNRTATLDPKSLEKMTTALAPFLRKLRADQKDELRALAHLMGLERLTSQL
jgi:hypothetical protein